MRETKDPASQQELTLLKDPFGSRSSGNSADSPVAGSAGLPKKLSRPWRAENAQGRTA